MALCRPTVNVYDSLNPNEVCKSVIMPSVMEAPLRLDIVKFVHTNISKNNRQAHGVKIGAGYQSSAESWGTGRAVARIPRVSGSGTHRAGQGAFGNMCRGGGMFAPLKSWRRWHRHINLKQRRLAIAASVAASSVTGLVLGHGHRINNIRELPLVVSDDIKCYTKAKHALNFLKKIGCEEELARVKNSKKLRAGVGKARNRRYVQRKGPLIIHTEDKRSLRAFRNIPGVELCNVNSLNLLKLAPGGVFGRFVIWTEEAFKMLDTLFSVENDQKISNDAKFVIPKQIITNPDLSRIINSNEIQLNIRPTSDADPSTYLSHHNQNPLKNFAARCRLDPAYKHLRDVRRRSEKSGTKPNQKLLKLIEERRAKAKLAKKNIRKRLNEWKKSS